jgi:CheY-like chemotaxis protein
VPKWVVLVEDNPSDIKVFSETLAQVSPTTKLEVFRDGSSAFEYFSRYNPQSRDVVSLVVLDLQVPRMSGVELVNEIKKKPETRTVPVLVVSGTGSPVQVEQLYVFGINSYVSKPANSEQYRECMKRILEYWLHVNEMPERQPNRMASGSVPPVSVPPPAR